MTICYYQFLFNIILLVVILILLKLLFVLLLIKIIRFAVCPVNAAEDYKDYPWWVTVCTVTSSFQSIQFAANHDASLPNHFLQFVCITNSPIHTAEAQQSTLLSPKLNAKKSYFGTPIEGSQFPQDTQRAHWCWWRYPSTFSPPSHGHLVSGETWVA